MTCTSGHPCTAIGKIEYTTRRTDQIVTDPGQLIWGIDHDLYEVEGHPYMLVQW